MNAYNVKKQDNLMIEDPNETTYTPLSFGLRKKLTHSSLSCVNSLAYVRISNLSLIFFTSSETT